MYQKSLFGFLGKVQNEETGASGMEFDSIYLAGLVGIDPALVLWIAVVIFAVVMLRWNGVEPNVL